MSGPASGYSFVPLPESVHRTRREHNRLDRRVAGTFSGRIELTFVCEQPVHVGSGFKRLLRGKLVRSMVRSGTTPVVPGSTMKGLLRSRYEAITRSCVLEYQAKQPKLLSRTHPDIHKAEIEPRETRKEPLDRYQRCREGSLCPACALFGYQSGAVGQRSRVSVSDFRPAEGTEPEIEPISPQFSPRLHHCGTFRIQQDKFLVGSLFGRKVYAGLGPEAPGLKQQVEVLPRQTRISGTLRVFNLELAELGALLGAIGHEPTSRLKVGAGKGLGFGRLRLEGVRLILEDPQGNPPDPQKAREAFLRSADRFAEGEQALQTLQREDC